MWIFSSSVMAPGARERQNLAMKFLRWTAASHRAEWSAVLEARISCCCVGCIVHEEREYIVNVGWL